MQDRHPDLDAMLKRDCFDTLDAVFTGEATDEQFVGFEQLLRDNEAFRTTAVHYLHLHALIERAIAETSPALEGAKLAGAAQESPAPSVVRATMARAVSSVRRPIVWTVLAAGILFAGYVAVISWNMLSRDRLTAGSDGQDVVATIRDEADAQWSPDSRLTDSSTSRGATIAANQPLSIQSGLIELELKQGTTLLIEGPADWKINGENSATLTRGKLVAKVPQQAIGFTLETPTAKIVDLGTEFGVEVAKDGAADVHVSKGLVDVQSAAGSAKPGPGKLQAGQSARITPAGNTVQNNSTLPDKFKRLVEAGKKSDQILAKPGSPLERWREASQKLRTDPSLVAYYDFESQGTQLKNVLADNLHGEIITKREKTPWTQGRWYGKHSLAFGKDFATVSVPADPTLRPKEDWTVAVWFRLDALPSPNAFALIVGKGNQPKRSYSLFVHSSGALDWSANSTDGRLNNHRSTESCKVRSWNLAVGVIESQQMHLYLNGVEASAALPFNGDIAFDEQPLMLGRSREPNAEYQPFDGVIDELSIFSRALSVEEIAEMYRNGKPER